MNNSVPVPAMWAHAGLFSGSLFEPLNPLLAAEEEDRRADPLSSASTAETPSGLADSADEHPRTKGPRRRERLGGLPRDYIDLARPFGPDEPLLCCPDCREPLNDCEPAPDDDAAQSVLKHNEPFACTGCAAPLLIQIIASPENGIRWQMSRSPALPQRGQLLYASDLEQAVAALQRRFLENSDLEELGRWIHEQRVCCRTA